MTEALLFAEVRNAHTGSQFKLQTQLICLDVITKSIIFPSI